MNILNKKNLESDLSKFSQNFLDKNEDQIDFNQLMDESPIKSKNLKNDKYEKDKEEFDFNQFEKNSNNNLPKNYKIIHNSSSESENEEFNLNKNSNKNSIIY